MKAINLIVKAKIMCILKLLAGPKHLPTHTFRYLPIGRAEQWVTQFSLLGWND